MLHWINTVFTSILDAIFPPDKPRAYSQQVADILDSPAADDFLQAMHEFAASDGSKAVTFQYQGKTYRFASAMSSSHV